MSRVSVRDKHVLLIGPALANQMEQALPGALLEVAGLDHNEAMAGLRPGLDLVVMDAMLPMVQGFEV